MPSKKAKERKHYKKKIAIIVGYRVVVNYSSREYIILLEIV